MKILNWVKAKKNLNIQSGKLQINSSDPLPDRTKDPHSIYLRREPYNEKLRRMGFARHRQKNRELGHNMAFGDRTENERVNKVVDFNAMHDTTICADLSMLHQPKWKNEVPDKWVSVVCSVSNGSVTVQNSRKELWS